MDSAESFRVATKNSSQTALSAFLQCVNLYGLPPHVCTEQGREKVLIAARVHGTKKGTKSKESTWYKKGDQVKGA